MIDAVLGDDLGRSVRDDDLLAAIDRADADAVGKVEVAERLADQRRGFERLGLDHLGEAVLDGVDAPDAAPPDMLEDLRDRHGPRVDRRVDAECPGEAMDRSGC